MAALQDRDLRDRLKEILQETLALLCRTQQKHQVLECPLSLINNDGLVVCQTKIWKSIFQN